MKKALTLFLSLALLATQAQAATIAQDVDRYLATLPMDRNGTQLEPLGWMGISDPRLYDVIEAELQKPAAQRPANGEETRKYRYYVRALGFSGQSKYVPTLNELARNKYYDNYAEHALRDLPKYTAWNPIISNRVTFNPQRSDDANRYLNMLATDDFQLNRIAARRISEGLRDDAVYEALEKKVRANYLRTGLSSDDQDCVAWMVKALGSSRMEKYRDLLIQVAQTSPQVSVVKHARLTLERNYNFKQD